MPLTYLDLTEAEIDAFGAQKQRRIHARRARAWKHMAREERDAGAAAPPKPPAATSRRPRYRRGERRKPEEPHPFADPNRPIPNLAAADRFECCSMVIGPILAVPQLGGATPGRLKRALVCHRKCAQSLISRMPMSRSRGMHADVTALHPPGATTGRRTSCPRRRSGSR